MTPVGLGLPLATRRRPVSAEAGVPAAASPGTAAWTSGGLHTGRERTRGESTGGENVGRPHIGWESLGAQDLGGQDLGAQDLGGQDLGGQDLGREDLGEQDLGRENTGREDLGREYLGGQDLGGQDLGRENTGREDSVSENTRRPDVTALVDRFGRTARDLRVSLTDRCNLRCSYCMPAEGLDWMPAPELLSDDELVRLLTIAVRDLGIEQIRFTGGEPLLRRGLVGLVERTAALRPRPEISLTTNGVGLARRAGDLARAGLDRVNISLDTLDRETFARITRRDRLADVLDGLAAAHQAGLRPVKINAVLLRSVNDHEAPDLLAFALAHGYHLRFIEQMPLDAGHTWDRAAMVTAEEIADRLGRRYDLTPHPQERRGAPAELFGVLGHPGATVGIIASVTRPFCGDCDRTRLTADGAVRNCLFARGETDLRRLLRGGAADSEIADYWREAMWGKAPGHGIDDPSFLQPDRPMSAIGG